MRRAYSAPAVARSARCYTIPVLEVPRLFVEWRCRGCRALFWRDATIDPDRCPHCDSKARGFELS